MTCWRRCRLFTGIMSADLLDIDPADCPLCVRAAGKPGGLHNMSLVCCRVRFLLGVPTLDLRRGWLDRWREKLGSEKVDQIKAEVQRRWANR